MRGSRDELEALQEERVGEHPVGGVRGVEAVPEDVARGVGARPRRALVAQHGRLDRARAAARPPGLEEPWNEQRQQLVLLLSFTPAIYAIKE